MYENLSSEGDVIIGYFFTGGIGSHPVLLSSTMDEIIESIGETDWLVQLDDELPKRIEGEVFIPMGAYHRLIKGTGDLKVKVIKL